MKTPVTAIFDIGKTNKKFFLFDNELNEVHREYIRINEVQDEDGFPSDDILAISKWVMSVFEKIKLSSQYHVQSINFSGYGASLVHLDKNEEVISPFYNYLKPIQKEVLSTFFDKYGPESKFMRDTGSPKLGLLNSGFQLFWLKHFKPEQYGKIKYSLHLPQYLSYLFSGQKLSDYTSIGCHTALWNYDQKDYHSWVYEEGIDQKLAPIVPSDYSFKTADGLKVGVGIHDSSAALLPYIKKSEEPFLLLSTGTWSICINPFSKGSLKKDDIENGCILNQRIDGKPVKVSRLFLGNEYKLQVIKLARDFQVSQDHHKKIRYNTQHHKEMQQTRVKYYKWESLQNEASVEESTSFRSFDIAYHQLIYELVLLQVEKIKAVINKETPKSIFIDGGFSENEVFIKMLDQELTEMTIIPSTAALGSAMGAALLLTEK